MKKGQQFSVKDFALRFVFALLLVLATFNATGWSLVHWLVTLFPAISPEFLVCALLLVIGWGIYIRATLRSLGGLGLILLIALIAAMIWLFVDLGWLSLGSVNALVWVVDIVVALVLSIGISWSHIRRKLSGQVDVDDIDQ